MVSEKNNQGVFYYDDDGEYRVYCKKCDKLGIERFFKNHLKSQTHTNNFREKGQLNEWFQIVF